MTKDPKQTDLEEFIKERMKIYCCACNANIEAYLVQGYEVLPHVSHLKHSNFWKCPNCRNFVGTRTVGKDDLAPTGAIVSKNMRKIQRKIRDKIEVILNVKKEIPNAKEILYAWLTKKLNYPYRTSAIMSKGEANIVMEFLKKIET